MDQEIKERFLKLQETVIGEVLTLAEIGLQPEQFRQFKKKVFQVYHDRLRPETIRLLHIFAARAVQRQLSGELRKEGQGNEVL